MILEAEPDVAALEPLSPVVREVILGALAKRPGDRPASAAAMRGALGAPPEGDGWGEMPAPEEVRAPVSAPTPASGPDAVATKLGKRKAPAPVPRRRWPFAAAAIGVAAAAGATAFVVT